MNTSKWALGAALAAIFSVADAADRNDISVAHFEPLQRLELRAASAEAAAAVRDANDLTKGGQLAHIKLNEQLYTLRITRAGKLILTK